MPSPENSTIIPLTHFGCKNKNNKNNNAGCLPNSLDIANNEDLRPPYLVKISNLPKNHFDDIEYSDPKLFALVDTIVPDYKVTIEVKPFHHNNIHNYGLIGYSNRTNHVKENGIDINTQWNKTIIQECPKQSLLNHKNNKHKDVFWMEKIEEPPIFENFNKIDDRFSYHKYNSNDNKDRDINNNNKLYNNKNHGGINSVSTTTIDRIVLNLNEFDGLFEMVSEDERAATGYQSVAELASKFPDKCLTRSTVYGHKIVPMDKSTHDTYHQTNITTTMNNNNNPRNKFTIGDELYKVLTRKFNAGEILYLKAIQSLPNLTRCLTRMYKGPGGAFIHQLSYTNTTVASKNLINSIIFPHRSTSTIHGGGATAAGESCNNANNNSYLKCLDFNGDIWYLPVTSKGHFTPFAKRENISGVHTLQDLIYKFQLPIKTRLIGYVNLSSEDSCRFVKRYDDERWGEIMTTSSYYHSTKYPTLPVESIVRLISLNREPEYNVYFLGTDSVKRVKVPNSIARKILVNTDVGQYFEEQKRKLNSTLEDCLSSTLLSLLEILYHTNKLKNIGGGKNKSGGKPTLTTTTTTTHLTSTPIISGGKDGQKRRILKTIEINCCDSSINNNNNIDIFENSGASDTRGYYKPLNKTSSMSTIDNNSSINDWKINSREFPLVNLPDVSMAPMKTNEDLSFASRTIRSDETHNRNSSKYGTYYDSTRKVLLSHLSNILNFDGFVTHLLTFKGCDLAKFLSELLDDIVIQQKIERDKSFEETSKSLNGENRMSGISESLNDDIASGYNAAHYSKNPSLPGNNTRHLAKRSDHNNYYETHNYNHQNSDNYFKHKLKSWLNTYVMTILNCQKGKNSKNQNHRQENAQDDIIWCY